MQNIILDLLTWCKILQIHATRTTSIVARDNLTEITDKISEIVDGLLTGKDSEDKPIKPEDLGQLLLRLWRITNNQEWQFSTLTVLGDESNHVSLILSLLRDTAENLLKGDYVRPKKQLVLEELRGMMNPVGICPICKKVIEAPGFKCPFCKKKVKFEEVTVTPRKEEPAFISKLGIDYESSPSGLKDEKVLEIPSLLMVAKAKKGEHAEKKKTATTLLKEKDIKVKEEKVAKTEKLVGVGETPWPCAAGNPERSGFSNVSGPGQGKTKWSIKLGGSLSVSPVIGIDGNVYVGTDEIGVVQILKSGTEGWRFHMMDPVTTPPCIGANGNVFLGTSRRFYNLNPDGSTRWSFRANCNFAPVIGPDDSVCFASDNSLFCLNNRGKLNWSYEFAGASSEAKYDLRPAIDSNGQIYVVTDHLYIFSPDGNLKHQVRLPGKGTSPAIGKDGRIYFGSGNMLFCFKFNGAQVWKIELRDEISSPPAIDGNNNIYFGCATGRTLNAIDSDTHRLWEAPVGAAVTGTPSVDNKGNVYFCTENARLYCLDKSGRKLWHITAKSSGFKRKRNFISSPALSSNGVLYATSQNGKLYAIE